MTALFQYSGSLVCQWFPIKYIFVCVKEMSQGDVSFMLTKHMF